MTRTSNDNSSFSDNPVEPVIIRGWPSPTTASSTWATSNG